LKEFDKKVDVLVVGTGCGDLASVLTASVSSCFRKALKRGSYE
tara:strand:+ start:630 stop:758 length:129 start_codon:yes stop_codon:yes gene_type:complete